MDTIEVNYPLDIQVQFLEMVSFLVVISQLLNKKKDHEHLKEFEKLLVAKIRNAYLRDGCLFNEPFEDRISSNIFLAYYFYPALLSNEEWEQAFDKALLHLKTQWGGIASLSHKDSRFKQEYTGENNLSYHNGDVWFWLNNYAAIAMNHLNEKKYRKEIAAILRTSTQDILKMGTIGFGSEVSSAKEQRAEGTQAQLWSTSTYLELIDQLFDRE
jgi:glycogen debranching enzyme